MNFNLLVVFFLLTIPVYATESLPTDDIVVKATDAVIFQMKANLNLTQDQITAVQPIIAAYTAKVRNLQQSLEDGDIDGRAMYNQRQQLTNDEYQQLGTILTSNQLKTWIRLNHKSNDISHRIPQPF